MLLQLRFLLFFENPKKRDFLRFFALLHTFSGTMIKRRCLRIRLLLGYFISETETFSMMCKHLLLIRVEVAK